MALMHRVRRVCAAILTTLLVSGALPGAAQETTGTLTGVVTDQTGALLPGVSVVVRHVQTGRSREFVTNEVGRYNAQLLQPGTYEVTFNLSGFQPSSVTGIEASSIRATRW